MKISAGKVTAFLANPDPKVAITLIYGPDSGLVRERVKKLAHTVVDDLNDPFRVIELTGGGLKADPPLLRDEAQAMAFGGGRRVVIVRDVTDANATVFSEFLDDPAGDALIVVEGGELGPRAALRKVFEAAGNGAALPCYEDDNRSLAAVIDETLRNHGMTISSDARAFLAGTLGSDRMVTRAELEKLALYKGEAGQITLEDAMACAGDTAAVSMDEVVLSALDGNAVKLDGALEKALGEGLQPVGILRAVARHLQRLHVAQDHMRGGMSADQAMKSLRPPVIFKQADAFRRQLRLWPLPRIGGALDIVTTAELECKTTGMPSEAICGRALLRLAQAARKGANR